MALPRFIVLKSKNSNNYLRYIKEDGEIHGFLQYSSEAMVSPYTKFEVEAAKTGQGLVHIRSAYNNKYWVRQNANNDYIIAGSNEVEEDQSKWSCTLFKPIYDSNYDAYRFQHVQLGNNACLWRGSAPFTNCIVARYSTPDKDLCDLSTITDWQSLCILPQYVAFKQGAYLKCFDYKGMYYLQFGASNITDDLAGHEVFPQNDGSIRIKSTHWNFWRRDPNWIKADSPDTTANNRETLFWPVKVADNIVALRNLGNNAYCKRLTQDGKENFLNAGVSTITNEAKMEVEEYVTSREIYNVQFQLADARIYGQQVLTMASKEAINNTPEANNVSLTLSYEKSTSSTWQTTLGMTLGVSMTMSSGIPIVAEVEIEISTQFSAEYSWGETKTETQTVEAGATVEVPPMSKRKVSIVATQGLCDIPFSYTQRDTLGNGKVVILEKNDGRYSGVNCYNFQTIFDVARSL